MSSLKRTPHVLVAEPQESDLELILEALRVDPELRVSHGRLGTEVLRLLESSGHPGAPSMPSLLLLDLTLRGPTAIELIRKLRKCTRTMCLPIVVLGNESTRERLAEAYEAGANSCLIKPANRSQFEGVVQKVTQYWLELNQLPQHLGAATSSI